MRTHVARNPGTRSIWVHFQFCCFCISVLEPHAPYDVPFKSIQQDFEEFLHQAVAFPRLQLESTLRTGVASSGEFNENSASYFSNHRKKIVTSPYHCCTAGYLSFGPMAQCVVHALDGLAYRARVAPASSPVLHYKQRSALTLLPSLHSRGCASPSCAR